jgi:predicted nucleic acid-binding protein
VLVLDASALLMALLHEPGWEQVFDLMARNEVTAPDLVVAEVGNGLWRRARTGTLAQEDARRAMSRTARAFDRLAPMAPLREAALDLALRRDHPVYDCFYVALARREGTPLLTADRRLARRFAADAEVRLLGGGGGGPAP